MSFCWYIFIYTFVFVLFMLNASFVVVIDSCFVYSSVTFSSDSQYTDLKRRTKSTEHNFSYSEVALFLRISVFRWQFANFTLCVVSWLSFSHCFLFCYFHASLLHAHSSFLHCLSVRNMYRMYCASICQRRCTSAWGRRVDTSTCVGMWQWQEMFSRLSSKSSSSRATWAWRMLASLSVSFG